MNLNRADIGRLMVGAVLWAAACTASAWLGLRLQGRTDGFASPTIAAYFAIGALVSWPLATLLPDLVFKRTSVSRRIAGRLILLPSLTVFATALAFAVVLRDYYAQWHGPFLSKGWVIQLVFTLAGGFYQFAVIALPYYVPVALAAMLVLVLWDVSKAR